MNSLLAKYTQDAPNMTEGLPEKVERDKDVAACRRRVMDLIPMFSGDRILDVGPACGWEIKELSERFGGHVTAVTLFSEEADVLMAGGFCEDVLVGDMHELPESWDERFGLVFASHVLEHSPAPYIFLCETARVLMPGGVLFLVMPNAEGGTYLGSERWKRLGEMHAHVFCASIETVIQMIRHVSNVSTKERSPVLEFESYHEVPQMCAGRRHYTHQVWIARKVSDDAEA